VYLPHVVLYHAESNSRGFPNTIRKTARQIRERRLMERRWSISRYRDPYYNPNLTLDDEDFTVRL
jgi:HEPN domain-containing protein